MFSTVRGIVSRPSVATCWSTSQSTAARTIALPIPTPCRSGRTASGPIHPSAPERWATRGGEKKPVFPAGGRLRPGPQGGAVWAREPAPRRAHDRFADPHALPVGANRERAHPPLGARAVGDVEGDDLPRLVAPHH